MAKALLIEDDYGRDAEAYYLKFPKEPISAKASLDVEKPAFIKQTSLSTLLLAIQKDAKAGTDIVIVSHGTDDGLTMGLFHGHPKFARTDNLNVLMGSETRDQKAEKLSLKPDLVTELLKKVDDVKKIGLGHIAFRGCSIGSNIGNLTTLKDLLGAKIVSATSLLSTYGLVGPRYFAKEKKQFEALWKQHQKSAHLHSGKSRAIFLTWPLKAGSIDDHVRLFFESEGGMLEWLQTYFIPGTTSATATSVKNKCPVHYLRQKPPVLPLDGTHKTHNVVVGYADFIRTSDEKP
jgi:hypothetical protein